jgi:riboflavin biosynthesis pyrimidine reductase
MAADLPIEPLDVLYDSTRPGAAPALPAELGELYGGDLELAEPRLYANFVSTIDGVVAIPSLPQSNSLIAAGSKGDHFVMALLRAFADCVLIGGGTLAASPHGTWLAERVFPSSTGAFAELRRNRGRPPKPQIAVVTGRGSIDTAHPVLASGALVLTSEAGAKRLEGRLPTAATVVALGEDERLDPSLVVRALRERGHRLILSEAGPHTFGALVAAGVMDELFLTISPLLAGNHGDGSRYGLVESAELLPPGAKTRLLSLRRHGQHLFLRYAFEHTNSSTREEPV